MCSWIKAITAADMKKLAEGVTLEDGFIQPDAISYVSSESKKEVGLEIHSGRNRIVRRMFEHLGYRVSTTGPGLFCRSHQEKSAQGKMAFPHRKGGEPVKNERIRIGSWSTKQDM